MKRERNQWLLLKGMAWVCSGLFFFQSAAQADVPAIEKEALVVLFNSTNGAGWRSTTNWLTGDPCADKWYGLTCDNNGNITRLNLRLNRLAGTIPVELSNLVNLHTLDLSGNDLSGIIPAEFGNLANLVQLNLAFNQLDGIIPPPLGNLANLEALRLGTNELHGSVPADLGDLTNLEALDLRINHLSGPIPAELGFLSKLKILRAEKNALAGELPLELGNLHALSTGSVDFRWNALFTHDDELDVFLNDKIEHDWSATQTVAPGNVWITDMGVHTASLAWDIIEYSTGEGRYHVSYSTTPGGPYMVAGATINKTESEITISGLPANTVFYFVVQTETDHNSSNTNIVISDTSLEVSGKTHVSTPGFFISPVDGLITSEIGGSDTFDVSLDTQPNADVTIALTSSDILEGVVSDDSLTFTSVDWDIPQTVTITGVDDDQADGNRQYFIITGMASSTDIDYDGIDPDDISVTNEDDGDVTTDALEALYHSTNGPEWSTNTNWLVGDPCKDNWHGVICDENANIRQIIMRSNKLSGNLPIELGDMAMLRNLDLQNNQLTGVIPTELGKLANLRELRLNANKLNGSIPGEVGNLAMLQILRLDQNLLSGPISGELGKLTNLRDLWLYLNLLSGVIPTELGNMTNLQSLRLRGNQLNGAIPRELGSLRNLKSLQLQHNQLDGVIPATLGNLTKLEDLYLDVNQLGGQIPPELGNLSNLKYLGLQSNNLDGTIPSELGNLNNLDFLYLYDNHLDGAIPAELGKMTSLRYLDLRNNQLSGPLPAGLGKLSNLGELYLQNNRVNGPIPTEFGKLTALYLMNLGNNQLSGSIPEELGQMTNLGELHLQNNMLSGPIPVEVGNLTRLHYMNLAGNQLAGPVPVVLASLPIFGLEIGPVGAIILHWNALYTFDDGLDAFLNDNSGSDWSSTQTISPENFQASDVGTNWVTLSWDPVEYTGNDGGYRVWYGTSAGGPYRDGGITDNKSSTSHTITRLNPGQDYYFVVTTETNSHGENKNLVISEKSEEIFVSTPPAKPTNIKATDGTFLGLVRITYELVSDATVYRVFRCLDNGLTCGSPIGYPTTGTFDDRNAVPGTVYHYRVRACIANTCGKFSTANSGFAAIQLPQPTGISASDGTFADQVHVSWNGVDGAGVYRVFRCQDTGLNCGSPIGFSSGTSFDDRKGVPDTVYYYRVKACKAQQCSKFSVANAGHRSSTPALKKDDTNTYLLPDQQVPIPALGAWGRSLLMLMMLGFGLVLAGRRNRAQGWRMK